MGAYFALSEAFSFKEELLFSILLGIYNFQIATHFNFIIAH